MILSEYFPEQTASASQIEKLTSAHARPEVDGDTVEDATSSFSLLLWEYSDPNWNQLYLGEVSILIKLTLNLKC